MQVGEAVLRVPCMGAWGAGGCVVVVREGEVGMPSVQTCSRAQPTAPGYRVVGRAMTESGTKYT